MWVSGTRGVGGIKKQLCVAPPCVDGLRLPGQSVSEGWAVLCLLKLRDMRFTAYGACQRSFCFSRTWTFCRPVAGLVPWCFP